jgi:hypothetical protein
MLQLFLSLFCLPDLVQSTQNQHLPQSAGQSSKVNANSSCTHTLTDLEMSKSSLPSSAPSSQGSDNSNETGPSSVGGQSSPSITGDDSRYEKNAMGTLQLKDGRQDYLSYIKSSASKEETPRYTTFPCIDDISRLYSVNRDLQSIVEDPALSTAQDPHGKKFDWVVDLALYPDPSSSGKIGYSLTHLGVDTTTEEKAAGLHTVDESAWTASAAFINRITKQHRDLVNTINATGNNTEIDKNEVEAAKTHFSQLYEDIGGEHSVHEFRNLLSTFEEKSQRYICMLRAKKQLASGGVPLDFGSAKLESFQWAEKRAPDEGH